MLLSSPADSSPSACSLYHLPSSRRAGLTANVSPAVLQAKQGFNTAMSEEVEGTRTSEEQQEMEDKVISPEKAEEAKLKARYPNLGAKPGGSDLLRKRLQKGPKYFDSGDYNMAKAKMKNKQLPSAPTEKTEITGGHIPTPQDLPQRKTSIVASKLAG
ncbi:cAMP-regulated phosphoprotein 19-like [Anarrhichthys ocellatus]|uniref:cAMP-regulated phosphoprotein 19-like n=2 Tax=Percomorphaceae TaxID=1489872 RepID=UPI0012EEA1D6|nr:cAMP-regulated phosphoprotein 19-like [Anarrhichthys ocellatus]